jgi:hypothetical protein
VERLCDFAEPFFFGKGVKRLRENLYLRASAGAQPVRILPIISPTGCLHLGPRKGILSDDLASALYRLSREQVFRGATDWADYRAGSIGFAPKGPIVSAGTTFWRYPKRRFPAKDNAPHEFVSQPFAEQPLAAVPLSRDERFADSLRLKLQ